MGVSESASTWPLPGTAGTREGKGGRRRRRSGKGRRRGESAPFSKEDAFGEHLGLVEYFAGMYAGRGAGFDDLFQEGCLGLLAAIERFDPSMGVEFATYASHFVKGRMKEFYRTKLWPCSVPRSMRDASMKVRELSSELGREPSRKELVEAGVPEGKAEDAIRASMVWHPVCFHGVESACEVNPLVDWEASYLDDGLESLPERLDVESVLSQTLDAEELLLVRMCCFEDLSQREVARRLGTNQMRVCRSMRASLTKLGEELAGKGRIAS